ncbi:MAG: hypothetical protein APF80_01200 [Alphaproteobacteria bacterium BRH_c36]|nr:MAG: hypothetical protein APF80_01200 [Alphaproteobacteria bacterium BRH_c36]
MPYELQMVLATTAILFVLLMYQGALVPITHGFSWGLGSRDAARMPSVMQARAQRTIANHLESMALFVPMALIASFLQVSTAATVWGSAIYVIGRLAFAGFYLGGVPVLRSVAWGISVTGLVMVAVELLGGRV